MLQAYADSHYLVCLDRHWRRLRLDCANPWLLDWLASPQGCWALIGAVNPGSRRYPPSLNERRHRCFCALLRRRGWPAWPARGQAADGSWVEPALWLPLPGLRQIDALACRFGQRAVLWGVGTGPGVLRCYPADLGACR